MTYPSSSRAKALVCKHCAAAMLLHGSLAQPCKPSAWFAAWGSHALFDPVLSTALEGLSSDLLDFPAAQRQLERWRHAAHSVTPRQLLDWITGVDGAQSEEGAAALPHTQEQPLNQTTARPIRLCGSEHHRLELAVIMLFHFLTSIQSTLVVRELQRHLSAWRWRFTVSARRVLSHGQYPAWLAGSRGFVFAIQGTFSPRRTFRVPKQPRTSKIGSLPVHQGAYKRGKRLGAKVRVRVRSNHERKQCSSVVRTLNSPLTLST